MSQCMQGIEGPVGSGTLFCLQKESLLLYALNCTYLFTYNAQEIFLETELEELGKEKYLCVAKGQPFIRKALSSAWFVKISMNREFKKDLHDAYLLKGDTRINRFQEISDKYFDDDVRAYFFLVFSSKGYYKSAFVTQDYDKMTAKEMQWYVDKYLAEGGDEFLVIIFHVSMLET